MTKSIGLKGADHGRLMNIPVTRLAITLIVTNDFQLTYLVSLQCGLPAPRPTFCMANLYAKLECPGADIAQEVQNDRIGNNQTGWIAVILEMFIFIIHYKGGISVPCEIQLI